MTSVRPWRPGPLLALSGLLHVAALATLAWHPGLWPWVAGAVLLDHLALTAVGLWPRSTWLGPNIVQLPPEAAARREVAITIDDGPDPQVTPQVLELLARHDARATFFCIGERAQAHPEICRAIVTAGHEIGNHGQRHVNHAALLGPSGWRREVGDAQATLHRITGQTPRYFRALAGLRNPFLDPVLHAMGLQLASWTRRGFDTVANCPDTITARLLDSLQPGDILLLHDGNAARTVDGRAVILEVLPRLLQQLQAQGLRTATLSAACKRA